MRTAAKRAFTRHSYNTEPTYTQSAMKDQQTDKQDCCTEEKPGFFKRIVLKLDSSMKEKADAKASESCCGSDKDGKGGKCC